MASSRPTVGDKVRIVDSGRVGEVIMEDPDDSSLMYKIQFNDGQVPATDWFPQSIISLDSPAGAAEGMSFADDDSFGTAASEIGAAVTGQRGAEEGVDVEGEESEDEETEDESTARVFRIRCNQCSRILTERGMKVALVADPDQQLYSTDLRTETLCERGPAIKIDTCECLVRYTCCAACNLNEPQAQSHAVPIDGDSCVQRARSRAGICGSKDGTCRDEDSDTDDKPNLGYHVVQPCVNCRLADHNGHYWLLNNVALLKVEEISGCYWSSLNHNGAPWDEPRVFIPAAPERLTCRICFDTYYQPVVVTRCGHSFCKGCLMRELDRNGQCPFDRQPISELGGWSLSTKLCEDVSRLKVRCKYGCWRSVRHSSKFVDGTMLSTGADTAGLPSEWCAEVVTLRDRSQHEASCPYREQWERAFSDAPYG